MMMASRYIFGFIVSKDWSREWKVSERRRRDRQRHKRSHYLEFHLEIGLHFFYFDFFSGQPSLLFCDDDLHHYRHHLLRLFSKFSGVCLLKYTCFFCGSDWLTGFLLLRALFLWNFLYSITFFLCFLSSLFRIYPRLLSSLECIFFCEMQWGSLFLFPKWIAS